MYVSEIFHSIQGEGRLAGTPSVFIRSSGCNLRCSWCDSEYTSWEPEGEHMDVDVITEKARSYDSSHVVITGGEPLLQNDISPLCFRLNDKHVTIETNATEYKDVEADLISMSPKLSNSTPEGEWKEKHEKERLNYDVIESWIRNYDYQLKFVVEEPGDVDEIERILESLKEYDHEKVLLMPEGRSSDVLEKRREWISEICKKKGYRFSPRLHVHLYGDRRGM